MYALMLSQPGIHLDATLYRNMVSTFTACNAPQMVLQITLAMIQQGHTLDPATAATALEALQQEGAWQAAGPLLKSCFAAGAVVSHVVIQRVLLACAGGSFWQAAREVLQVGLQGIAACGGSPHMASMLAASCFTDSICGSQLFRSPLLAPCLPRRLLHGNTIFSLNGSDLLVVSTPTLSNRRR